MKNWGWFTASLRGNKFRHEQINIFRMNWIHSWSTTKFKWNAWEIGNHTHTHTHIHTHTRTHSHTHKYIYIYIQVRRTRHAGHCWRSRDELIRDVLLWIPTHGRAKAGRPARTYIQQLCEDTGCCPEDLPKAMNDREEWRERVRDIRATSAIWWWWWWYIIKHSIVFSYSFIVLRQVSFWLRMI